MSPSNYQLDKQRDEWSGPTVLVADLERVFEQAMVVRGKPHDWVFKRGEGQPGDTHEFRLVCPKPIVRDRTSEMLALVMRVFDINPHEIDRETFKRHASKLLGEGL